MIHSLLWGKNKKNWQYNTSQIILFMHLFTSLPPQLTKVRYRTGTSSCLVHGYTNSVGPCQALNKLINEKKLHQVDSIHY